MTDPVAVLADLRVSTAALLAALDGSGWSDADLAAPSLCQGWTRGHVLSHLARNADGIADTLAGALRGEVVQRYPDGWAARNAAIDAGAGRSFPALAADVRTSAERLDEVFRAVGEAPAWDRETEKGHPASHWPMARWKEVEIHRVDLAADHTPDRWPARFVAGLLEPAVRTVPDRSEQALIVTVTADGSVTPDQPGRQWRFGDEAATEVRGPDWAVLAWLIGRASAAAGALTATPPLGPWN
jgi:maleylpyruvate isomerase